MLAINTEKTLPGFVTATRGWPGDGHCASRRTVGPLSMVSAFSIHEQVLDKFVVQGGVEAIELAAPM